MELRVAALEALCIADPAAKCAAVHRLWAERARMTLDPAADPTEPAGLPGRPDRPRLVAPQTLSQRSPFTPGGRAALLHAIAHIEFNAINIGLRFVTSTPLAEK